MKMLIIGGGRISSVAFQGIFMVLLLYQVLNRNEMTDEKKAMI